MKPAFSTVACPDWTLDMVASRGEAWGFLGVELRTFGPGSRQFACDPALTSTAKARQMFDKAGMEIMCVATSIRYDEPVSPPVLGHVFPTEQGVAETKHAIELASSLECPLVRVFGFELRSGEDRAKGIRRIVGRLEKAADACRNRGVRLVLENGGSFARASELAELLDAVSHPLVAAGYSVAEGVARGDDPVAGVNALGDRLACVKVQDYRGGEPCVLGEGRIDNRGVVEGLGRMGFGGWVVYEHPRAWLAGAPEPEVVMAASAKALYQWMGSGVRVGGAARVAAV